jgi:hypothetical protein
VKVVTLVVVTTFLTSTLVKTCLLIGGLWAAAMTAPAVLAVVVRFILYLLAQAQLTFPQHPAP